MSIVWKVTWVNQEIKITRESKMFSRSDIWYLQSKVEETPNSWHNVNIINIACFYTHNLDWVKMELWKVHSFNPSSKRGSND